MQMFLSDRQCHEVRIVDVGTLDTTISVDGHEMTFNMDYVGGFRNHKTGALTGKGMRILAEEVLEDYYESVTEHE